MYINMRHSYYNTIENLFVIKNLFIEISPKKEMKERKKKISKICAMCVVVCMCWANANRKMNTECKRMCNKAIYILDYDICIIYFFLFC